VVMVMVIDWVSLARIPLRKGMSCAWGLGWGAGGWGLELGRGRQPAGAKAGPFECEREHHIAAMLDVFWICIFCDQYVLCAGRCAKRSSKTLTRTLVALELGNTHLSLSARGGTHTVHTGLFCSGARTASNYFFPCQTATDRDRENVSRVSGER
jgi:hypothetical protein